MSRSVHSRLPETCANTCRPNGDLPIYNDPFGLLFLCPTDLLFFIALEIRLRRPFDEIHTPFDVSPMSRPSLLSFSMLKIPRAWSAVFNLFWSTFWHRNLSCFLPQSVSSFLSLKFLSGIHALPWALLVPRRIYLLRV